MLVWTDVASGIVGNSQAPLVNDLRLSVTGFGEYRGNNFNETMTGTDNGYSYRFTVGPALEDTINNVEAIFVPANTFPAGQQLTLKVTGISVPGGTQKFALYAYNVQ